MRYTLMTRHGSCCGINPPNSKIKIIPELLSDKFFSEDLHIIFNRKLVFTIIPIACEGRLKQKKRFYRTLKGSKALRTLS